MPNPNKSKSESRKHHFLLDSLLKLDKENAGVDTKEIQEGDEVTVVTKNHTYTIIKKGKNFQIKGNEKYCKEFVEAQISGSTWGGSMIKQDFIGLNMYLEFRIPSVSKKLFTSSEIKDVIFKRKSDRTSVSQAAQRVLGNEKSKSQEIKVGLTHNKRYELVPGKPIEFKYNGYVRLMNKDGQMTFGYFVKAGNKQESSFYALEKKLNSKNCKRAGKLRLGINFLGRSEDLCNITFENRAFSQKHLRVDVLEGGMLKIVALESSTNGTSIVITDKQEWENVE